MRPSDLLWPLSCPVWQNPARYVMYGDVSAKAAQMLRDPEVEHFFTRLIQRVAPKSYTQGTWINPWYDRYRKGILCIQIHIEEECVYIDRC